MRTFFPNFKLALAVAMFGCTGQLSDADDEAPPTKGPSQVAGPNGRPMPGIVNPGVPAGTSGASEGGGTPVQPDAVPRGAAITDAPVVAVRGADAPVVAVRGADGPAVRPVGGADGPAADGTTAAGRCLPNGGGPHWLEEGGNVEAKLACATGLVLAGTAFEVAGLPPGARYDAATATVCWTPTLSQAGVYRLAITVKSLAETGEIKIGIADRHDDPMNVPIADVATYTEELGLPVFHLTTAPGINRDNYTPARVVYRGKSYEMEAQLRGQSSFQYPKKNFTFKFAKDNKFSDPAVAGGFMGKRKVCLITTFDDNAHVRYRMGFELWNRTGGKVAVQHYSAVLYLNGKYHGLYAVSDKIDGNLFQAHGMNEDGNLFMGYSHDANFASWRYDEGKPQDESQAKASLAEGYEKKAGFPEHGMPGAYDEIKALTELVARSDDARFTAQIPTVLHLPDYIDWIIHTTPIQAFDTLGKNSLHYHDPQTAGARWRMALWDFNECLGQDWATRRRPQLIDPKDIIFQASGGGGYTNRNRLWRRLWDHPQFGPQIRKRYADLLRNELKVEVVLGAFDAMVKETAASARRDERKWQTQYRAFFERSDHNSYEQEVAYVRRWIQDRWADLTARYR